MRFEASAGGRSVLVEVRPRAGGYSVLLDGETLEVDVVDTGDRLTSLLVGSCSYELAIERNGVGFRVHFPHDTVAVELADAGRGPIAERRKASGPARVTAPMPGRIVRVLASAGRDVAAGEGLVVVEAMKMENELRAPRAGRVQEIAVGEGQAVEAGALLVVIA